MSIGHLVFLRRADMPTPIAWAAAIRAAGFPMELDVDFDVDALAGFLPCTDEGNPAGFEYACERVADAELDDDARACAGGRDVVVSLVTHGDLRGLATAVAAGATLAGLADGVLWNESAGEAITARAAPAHAREVIASVRADLAAAARPAPPPAGAHVVDVALPARVVFRGAALMSFDTIEPAPRRLNVRLETASLPTSDDVEVRSLWQHPTGAVSVRALRIGGALRTFDTKGKVEGAPAPDAAALARRLCAGDGGSAVVDALVAAGDAAVPHLRDGARGAAGGLQVRTACVVALGKIATPAARAALQALVDAPALGEVVGRTLARLR